MPKWEPTVGVAVAANTAHSTGDGSDHSDVALNTSSHATLNGVIIETIAGTVASDGAIITFTLAKSGGGNLTAQLSGVRLTYTAGSIALSAGTDAIPVLNYLYIEDVAGTATLATSTTAFPATEFAPVATVLCQSAASLQTQGAYKVHLWTDHLADAVNQGHLSHMNKWIRQRHAAWESGGAPTTTIAAGPSPDTLDFSTTAGMALQLHSHSFPVFNTATGSTVFVVNDNATAYKAVTDLELELTDSLGASMSGKFYSLVFWLVVSEASADCKLMCNLPSGSYFTQTLVEDDSSMYADYSIPAEFKGTGVLIAEVKLRHQAAAGGQHTEISTTDLRGLQPSLTAGGGLAQSSEFSDALFAILDATDPSKRTEFDVSAITAATTRTITMPDADVTLGGGGIRTIQLSANHNNTNAYTGTGANAYLSITNGGTATFQGSQLPSDFGAISTVDIKWAIPVGAGQDIDLTSGRMYDGVNHLGTQVADTTSTYTGSATSGAWPVSAEVGSLFSAAAAGDSLGLKIMNNSGNTIRIFSIDVRFT